MDTWTAEISQERVRLPLCVSYGIVQLRRVQVLIDDQTGRHSEAMAWALGGPHDDQFHVLGVWRLRSSRGNDVAMGDAIASDLKVRGLREIGALIAEGLESEVDSIKAAYSETFTARSAVGQSSSWKPKQTRGARDHVRRCAEMSAVFHEALTRALVRRQPFPSCASALKVVGGSLLQTEARLRAFPGVRRARLSFRMLRPARDPAHLLRD